MEINYDQEVDILRILLTSATIEESDEVESGVIFDYDPEGKIVGIEILDASQRTYLDQFTNVRINPQKLLPFIPRQKTMLSLHNFEWEGERLVQVETQPHHLAGILAVIQETLAESDCEWDDLYSAYYECEEDATITFYESEVVDEGNPGIWTYVVYDCAVGAEEVVTNLNIDIYDPALQLQKMLASP